MSKRELGFVVSPAYEGIEFEQCLGPLDELVAQASPDYDGAIYLTGPLKGEFVTGTSIHFVRAGALKRSNILRKKAIGILKRSRALHRDTEVALLDSVPIRFAYKKIDKALNFYKDYYKRIGESEA